MVSELMVAVHDNAAGAVNLVVNLGAVFVRDGF